MKYYSCILFVSIDRPSSVSLQIAVVYKIVYKIHMDGLVERTESDGLAERTNWRRLRKA